MNMSDSSASSSGNSDPGIGPSQFPSLSRLGRFTRRVPFVAQVQSADCGAACLAMVLAYHGREVELSILRDLAGIGRDGVSASTVLEAAEHFGFRGRGLRVEVEDLEYVPTASILHWNFNHFVVFERTTPRGVSIVDPGSGRRFVPWKQFRRAFTGVVLTFDPPDNLVATRRTRRPLKAYLDHLRRQGKSLSRVLFSSVILRLFALALPLLIGLVVDRVVPRGDRDFLWLVAAGVGVLLLFQFLFSLIRSHMMLELRTQLDTQMTLGFLDHLTSLPYAFFQHRSAGDLMMRVNSNTEIRDILTAGLLSALLDGALVVSYWFLMAYISLKMALLVLALGLAQVLVFFLSRHRYRDLMSEELEARSLSQGYLVQVMAGIETLKLAGAERRAVEHWSNLFVDELNVSLRRGRVSAVVSAALEVLGAGAPLSVLAFGALQVISGELSIGAMLSLNALAVGFLSPLGALVSSCLQLQLLGGFFERIDDVLRMEPEQPRGAHRLSQPLHGEIELSDVSFAYSGRGEPVVRSVSLKIEAGTSLAIVGSSGSGKSTLAKLIAGVYTPTSGHIRFDGHDVEVLDRVELRRKLGVVPQAPYLFGGPLRRNIALCDPGLSQREIVAAAKIAVIHDEIMLMPMGYETLIDNGGSVLSGGQRQRIALARALAHRPAILILDEATSQLDARTERKVMENLESMPCTRIIIAHRLSTVVRADRIIVVEDGRICEMGTHEQLLARRGSYASLVATQTQLAGAPV